MSRAGFVTLLRPTSCLLSQGCSTVSAALVGCHSIAPASATQLSWGLAQLHVG
ncbi:hypothetical protein PF005_g19315 [Phytophthora fragariae]|uniref:Uncharacterized protein n=2 Tax=Phytophthora TaxID=4783 RepID=A0A6A3XLA6_9STRA|nr:hypothetical protein PF003_g23352 [Phytophthora fragariae]KAE8976163.1 hypothetical protein PR002_g25388 [Phytophthora rubi]KAE8929627.1 hypothetical protein PF009_g20261 [Phytophthora fragariae]KAE8977300.1 hypothetical protein PR001_g25167 [Phytophthora rubi]KAE8990631.1 hypothetical protein PF011_g18270 [Phytophthora fragariae]